MIYLAALLAFAAPQEKTQLLVLDLDAVDVDKAKVSILNGRIASLLSAKSQIEAVTSSDIQAMAKLEANKAAVGCDESSCLAEIANALGARYVVYGRVGKLDETILLQLNLFDASVGKPVSRQEAQGAKLQDLSNDMPQVLDGLLKPLGLVSTAPVTQGALVEQKAAGPSPLFLAGAGVAGVGALAALGLGGWSLAMENDLDSKTSTLPAKQFAFDNGWLVASGAIGGVVVAVAGGALLAVSMGGP